MIASSGEVKDATWSLRGSFEFEPDIFVRILEQGRIESSGEVKPIGDRLSTPQEDLRLRTKQFALRILRLFRSLPKSTDAQVLGKQLLRSGTSIGANYRAAGRARSKAEFVSRIGVVVEEADETVFWLELLNDGGIVKPERLRELMTEANELAAIFAAAHRTARSNR